MLLGEIKDQSIKREYEIRIEEAIAAGQELLQDPDNSEHAAMIGAALAKLQRIAGETKQGRALDDIVGLTKFAGDWPIARGKLALAIWRAEEYFSERILRALTGADPGSV